METLRSICSYHDMEFPVAQVKTMHDPYSYDSSTQHHGHRRDSSAAARSGGAEEDEEEDLEEDENVDRNYFLAATRQLRQDNELRILLFDDSAETITDVARYDHAGEVVCMEPHPRDPRLVATGYHDNGKSLASLWRMALPGEESEDDEGTGSTYSSLEELAGLSGQKGRTQEFSWSADNKLLNLSALGVHVWKMEESGKRKESVFSKEVSPPNYMLCGSWDPHHREVFATGQGSMIDFTDLRDKSGNKSSSSPISAGGKHHGTKVFGVENHVQQLSWNPNRPNTLAAAYDDGSVRIWDIRNPNQPVKVLTGHSHWVTSVQYNPFHDQLVISSGNDGKAILWRASSVSSAPLIEMEDESDKRSSTDLAVGVYYGDDQKKLYNAAWSWSDAWTSAIATTAGTVEILRVPQKEKYKILL
eukprot:gb/GECG01011935.1/.p1 GENE.gb/GECG01011935.1/~~gb/GECG01011935.1/.p1  ORF type:complete len:417 (+),score=55.10 gb/GECG01011935.1/:1-1251(+)